MVDLVIDPGHGGTDPGALGKSGLKEKECTLYISKKVKELLENKNVTVEMTRDDDSYVTLEERANFANLKGARYFISIHINSAEVDTAEGTEIYALSKGGEGEKLSAVILEKIVSNLQLKNRGVKYANFTVLKQTNMPAILVEVCFISNIKEETLLKDEIFKNRVAVNIANGFLRYIGKSEIPLDGDNETIMTPIISKPQAIQAQAIQWAKDKNAAEVFISLADLYWKFSEECGGVNPLVAYAQSALETNYGKYTGKVPVYYKNPCGLKKSDAKGDNPEDHAQFSSWEDGVHAHLDHLALYAGAKGYPKLDTKDPRHFQYLLGRAKYVETLSGNWAPSDNYGIKILSLMDEVEKTIVKEEPMPDTPNDNNNNNNNGSNNENNNDNTTNDGVNIDEMRAYINEISGDMDNLKNKINLMNKYLNAIDVFLKKEENIKNILNDNNKSLTEKNKSYEQTLEDILNSIAKIRNIG
ncbi:N-acetylmuramoyl-L-alanine amidase [Clostridium sp. YIM B02551]|uniref:N-acetylmuramoyl-L-alanine amidase n=1 Tax=Clostridium sp. YIM B02551 TaxID=2910679 RepID=UPI001EEAEA1D|nr:N-acetylmuramoyl-L-alanine amidase [Clostridium sp. YIM B02551]